MTRQILQLAAQVNNFTFSGEMQQKIEKMQEELMKVQLKYQKVNIVMLIIVSIFIL